METINLKEEALSLIDKLPENFTWSDLISAIHLRQRMQSQAIHIQGIKPEVEPETLDEIEKERHIDRPQNFWEAVQKFRQENNLEEEGIEPEVFEGVRDK
ncbi:hypothetical protein K4039_12715 [Lyngbya sp. CCAP 1446/10]|uniref:hypothetical protein n=1 Tax=Lyngbya sp. CCAP 1446/10 TaxID=439293 RepID=UPI00223869D7|nr:hypothetical protein [Lyngbya sp. CCAP 1446/10]MCW6050925.1 hypothetical protein [Lyngbya sp. CCAP 1446/10]